MITARDQFAAIAHEGEAHYARTTLASGHASVTRSVRRHRTVRAAAGTVAGVGVIGGATWGSMEAFARGNAMAPGVPASSTATSPPIATTASLTDCGVAAMLVTDPSATAYPNGELPPELLCDVNQGFGSTVTLRGDAGVSLEAVISRFKQLDMTVPCLLEGYRSLAYQTEREAINAARDFLVAEPGLSVHGDGLTVDLCTLDGNSSDQYADFAALAAEFGWIQTLEGQPWHFEYTPGSHGQGASVEGTITIPSGKTLDFIAGKLAAAYGIPAEDANAAIEAAVHAQIPEAATAEGWPMPGTFDLTNSPTVADAADQLVSARVTELSDLGAPRSDWQRVLTEASLVEKEAKLDVDKPKVARVIENRLEQGMKLQLDSTVLYLAHSDGPFTTEDERATDSPYNTYVYAGLPPGAIASPSDESIAAVLNAAEGDWLFFVTVNFETGEMAYASTYPDHLKNVQILHDWENARATQAPSEAPSNG